MVASNGFDVMTFKIEQIENGFAYGTNNMGQHRHIPLSWLPAKGAYPQIGEQWLITKSNGYTPWRFESIINAPPPPVITGSRSSGAALTNLLAALSAMGLIVDETTS